MALRDQLNVSTKSELYDYVLAHHQIVTVPGTSAIGDTDFKYYYYDTASTASDDGETVLKPTSVMMGAPGRWLKLTLTQNQVDWNQATSGSIDFIKNKPSIPSAPTVTDLSGTPVSITKWGVGTVSPSTGNGYSIDISGVGLTNLLGYSITPIKNTATPTSAPKLSVKSESNTAIVVNIIEGNASTINILGSLVLLGTSEQFAVTTGLTLRVLVWGN